LPGGSSDEEEEPPPEADEQFDPALDDADEAWVSKQRGGGESDAVLSCPCCLTTLCLDCQQHCSYAGQFRAMFVRHCRVERGAQLRAGGQVAGAAEAEAFWAVHCASCETQVGVVDVEEVYHFFHVVATSA